MVTQNMLRTHEEKWAISVRKKIRFMTALDLIECLKQIKSTDKLNIRITVCILYSNSEHVAQAWRKIGRLSKKKIRFVTALDLIECLKQIKSTDKLNIRITVCILYSNSEHVAQAWRKIGLFVKKTSDMWLLMF